MKTKAAILEKLGQPLILDEIQIPSLKPGQVLIEIHYSGVCHTQLLEARGQRGEDPYLPHLLGHEGSGIVLEIGPQVQKVKPGDSVILSWMKGSGNNVLGSIYEWRGKKVNAGSITTFSKLSVISENRLTVIPSSFSKKLAALLGCALPTGLGAVFNTAKPSPGQSMAIFGCGGVGLCALQAAVIAGCCPVIAVDILEHKLDLAKKLGATHCINASKEEILPALSSFCPKLDFAIEATGAPQVMNTALEAVRAQGGTTVIIGNAHYGKHLSLNPKEFNLGKRLLGTWGGDNDPDQHFPKYLSLIHQGRLCCDTMIEKEYPLEKINEALNDLEAGKAIRPLISMGV